MSEGGGFFRGTSADQDVRFANKEQKFLSQMKVPVEYATKVDMKKVQLEVIKPWISQQITKLLGFEDEVLIGYVFGLLEEKQFPDPKILHVNITGFLEQDASEFCRELWKLLISAQNSIGGIPPQFLAKKKNDILSRKVESDRIKAELAKRREEGQASADNIDEANDDMEIKEEVDKIKATEEVDKSIEELNKKYKNQGWDNDDDDKKSDRKRSRSRSRSRDRKKPDNSRRRSSSQDRRRPDSRNNRRRSRERSRDRRDDRRNRRSLSRDRSRDSRRSRDDRRDRDDRRRRDDRKEKKKDDSSEDDKSPKRRRNSDDQKRHRSSSSDRRSSEEKETKSSEKEGNGKEENGTRREQELREKALASMAKSKDSE